MNDTWIKDPQLIQRARIVLVLFLSKKSKGERVELIMSRLEDSAIQGFCEKVLDPSDLAYIEEGRRRRNGTSRGKRPHVFRRSRMTWSTPGRLIWIRKWFETEI